ncbi:MAG: hypothetical protein WCK49_09900 [Myxococcaceae bacterium]
MKKMINLLLLVLCISTSIHAETLAEKAKKFKQREIEKAEKAIQPNVSEMVTVLNATVMAKIALLNQSLLKLQGNVTDHAEAIEILIGN